MYINDEEEQVEVVEKELIHALFPYYST